MIRHREEPTSHRSIIACTRRADRGDWKCDLGSTCRAVSMTSIRHSLLKSRTKQSHTLTWRGDVVILVVKVVVREVTIIFRIRAAPQLDTEQTCRLVT